MRTLILALVTVSLLLLSGGCKSSGMVKATEAQAISPTADSAIVIFLRPSVVGGGVQSVVYDTTHEKSELVGIVSSGSKVAFKTTRGEHSFMVVSESADFMRATLDANKTYYALVTPRMGAFRARFSLRPVTSEDIEKGRLAGWERSCVLYENAQGSRDWAVNNAASVEKRRAENYPRWLKKSAAKLEEVTLHASDGR
ncbi:MAG: hypothetical protein NTV94_14930 [Planctomycetota bacterium]|nr:hypothetical protein [Planctomycetota bacterium]